MKRVIICIPLLLLACKNEGKISESSAIDSSNTENKIVVKIDSTSIKDSIINSAPIVEKVLQNGVNREVIEENIIRNGDGEQIPFTVGEEFTQDNQRLILKIKNFTNPKISAKVNPKDENMNIRINQIKLPDGTYDGPFSRELLDYQVSTNGEIWLVIGKSSMANGESKGHFSVSVE